MKGYSVRSSDALFAELTHEARKRGLSISALARERLTASFAAAPALTRGRVRASHPYMKAKRIRRR